MKKLIKSPVFLILSGIGLFFIIFITICVIGVKAVLSNLSDKGSAPTEAFLNLVEDGQIKEAREFVSSDFASYSDSEMIAKLEEMGLTTFLNAKWNGFHSTLDKFELKGIVKNLKGDRIQLEVILKKENGDWKIVSISDGNNTLVAGNTNLELDIPTETELARLTEKAIINLNHSLQSGDFESFHATLSKTFQRQITPAELESAFQKLIDANVDFASIKGVTPEFQSAERDGQVLKVNGFYPTAPMRTTFELTFVREKSGWELLGIYAGTQPFQLPVPTMDETRELIELSMIGFDESIKNKDFSKFMEDHWSAPFNQNYTPEEILEGFEGFVTDTVDFSAVDNGTLKITQSPKFENDRLVVSGEFTTAEDLVTFDFSWTAEGNEWKLASYDLNSNPLVTNEASTPEVVEEIEVPAAKTITQLSPIEDLIQFLKENAELEPGANREEFARQLEALTQLSK